MATTDAEKLNLAREIGIVETEESFEEVLNNTKLLSENAIPIPDQLGKVFEERYKLCKEYYKAYHDEWKKAFNAFFEDGSSSDYEQCGYAKENFVRSITQSLMDFTYMQNPSGEFTSEEEAQKEQAKALSTFITKFVNKANGRGLNLRPHVLRLILYTHLTNHGIIKVHNKAFKGSRSEATKLYNLTENKIREADEGDDIATLMTLLGKLYDELQTRQDAGVKITTPSPFNVMIDPNSTMEDLSDADYLFELEMIDEGLLKSEYMEYNEAENIWFFKYKSTVEYTSKAVSKNSASTVKEQILEEIMPEIPDEERSVLQEGRVACVWVYDKTTRRIYLYMKDQWEMPIWVFEDEMKLSRFFPHHFLAFSPSSKGLPRYSEVAYYHPFQEEVNSTNQQIAQLRVNAFSTFLYNSQAIDKKEVDKVFNEMNRRTNEYKAIGVKLRDDEKQLMDALKPFVLPIAQANELLNNDRYTGAIDRTSRISSALRGGEFRTNTVSDAVDAYSQQTEARISSFMDPIEEVVAQVMWSITEIVVVMSDKLPLTSVVSKDVVDKLPTMSVDDFNSQFAFTIEAGSIEKASSSNKKKEAMQIIQMLGQFGTAAPRTVLGIVTKLLRNVFSPNLVSDKDLSVLEEEGMAAMQKGVSTQNQPPQQNMKGNTNV